ncbi:MAG TPA: hypothetical protein DEF06_01660, partial [Clostridiales bacterium]|nr:hypothetical protein [Clostridiales bacterium]
MRDKDAQPVAFPIEMLLFKNSAAPDANEIDPCAGRQFQKPRNFFVRFFRRERLAGDPVSASAPNRSSVDHNPEAGKSFVEIIFLSTFGILQPAAQIIGRAARQINGLHDAGRPNAEAAGNGRFPVGGQLKQIERLLAGTIRIPELWIFNGNPLLSELLRAVKILFINKSSLRIKKLRACGAASVEPHFGGNFRPFCVRRHRIDIKIVLFGGSLPKPL